MATKIKHILNNLEVQPPPGVWPEIAARLNAEFDAEDAPVAQKMFELSVMPPAGLWSNIAAELNPSRETDEVLVANKLNDISVAPPATVWEKIAAYLSVQQPAAKKEGRVIALHTSRKAIIAAAAMVLLTVGAWYFLDKTNNTTDTPEVAGKATTAPANSNGSTAPDRTRAADMEIGEHISPKPIAALTTSADVSMLNNRYSRHGARRKKRYDGDRKSVV